MRFALSCLALAVACLPPAAWRAAGPAWQDQAPSSPAPVPASGSDYVVPSPSQSVAIGNFYLRRRKYRGALSRFQEAAHSEPDYAPAYLGLGRTFEKLGKYEQALRAYQKYLDLLPSDRDAEEARDVHRAIERLRRQHAAGE